MNDQRKTKKELIEELRLLHDGPCTAGAGSVSWNGADDAGRMLPSGIYFARLQSASGVSAQRVVLK